MAKRETEGSTVFIESDNSDEEETKRFSINSYRDEEMDEGRETSFGEIVHDEFCEIDQAKDEHQVPPRVVSIPNVVTEEDATTVQDNSYFEERRFMAGLRDSDRTYDSADRNSEVNHSHNAYVIGGRHFMKHRASLTSNRSGIS